MLNDAYGEASAAEVDDFVADCDSILKRMAYAVLSDPSRQDDLLQEGRITLWQTFKEYAEDPDRVAISLNRAKRRMQQVAWRNAPTTGNPAEKRRYEATSAASVEALAEAGVMDLLTIAQSLGDVEIAYHRGEILKALNELTEKQRKYVYARFWCGMDTSDGGYNNPGVGEARKNNPFLTRDVLWTGNKTSQGAKKVLAEKLSHLHALVRT